MSRWVASYSLVLSCGPQVLRNHMMLLGFAQLGLSFAQTSAANCLSPMLLCYAFPLRVVTLEQPAEQALSSSTPGAVLVRQAERDQRRALLLGPDCTRTIQSQGLRHHLQCGQFAPRLLRVSLVCVGILCRVVQLPLQLLLYTYMPGRERKRGLGGEGGLSGAHGESAKGNIHIV